jgi:protein involved in polysaccharide export with SLBB domain
MKTPRLLILFLFAFGYLYSEDASVSVPNSSISDSTIAKELAIRAQMAMATPDYLVTPGDIYKFGFFAGKESISYSFIVDSSYKVRVANLGVINANGMKLIELKKEVEDLVNKNYPFSGVQFALNTPATYNVIVRGEVVTTTTASVWGLSRLSSVLTRLTANASLRDIEIKSQNGKVTTYDFFKAQRDGDLNQDPYLRPGDIITIKRYERSVTVNGAVNRPGTYQLLEGENLSKIISYYGSGLTTLADLSRIDVVRYKDTESKTGEKIFLKAEDVDADYALKNNDTVTIASRSELLPVMYLEGAIGTPGAPNPQVSTRIEVRFNEGENYASLVRNYRTSFTTISDTRNAYIVRGDKRIPLNLSDILFDTSYKSEHSVMNEDVLVVPFRQFFVTVTGAVMSPGRYAYIPDRDWKYYVALAGGFNKEKNAFDAISIRDMLGKKRHKKEFIEPETLIDAKNSTFVYYFNKYSPVIVTTLGIIVSYYTVRDVVNKH